MDFSKIKNLIKQGENRFIMLENGEPEFVILSFSEYERLLGENNANPRISPNQRTDSGVTTRIEKTNRNPREVHNEDGLYMDLEKADDPEPLLFREAVGLPSNTTSAGPTGVGPQKAEFAEVDILGLPVRLEDIRLEDLPI